MTAMQAAFSEFQEQYGDALAHLLARHPEDEALESLRLAEGFRRNSGSDGYAPDWLRPFAAIAAQMLAASLDAAAGESDALRASLTPILARVAQLGYTEGYFEGKSD
ncbi:MAG: hypothetical protein L0177_12540 [Chloroflexi bacterium]|nr:hypothetical protein [Chloroflexota bacterium]